MYKLYLTISLAFILMVGLTSNLISFSSGAPAGRSGSPIDVGTCAASSCHASFPLNSGPGSMSITSDIPAAGFIAGDSYSITVSVSEAGKGRFAFQSSVYGEQSMKTTGTVTISDLARTQRLTTGGNEWVTHTFNGITSTDQSSWSYRWLAPSDNDSVTIYASAMASNANRNNSGDQVYNINIGAKRQFGVSVDPSTAIQELKAYPSPASEQIFVEFTSEAIGPAIITLSDMQGREVYRYEDDVTPGFFQNAINVQSLPSGMYTLRTSLNGTAIAKKVIVD